MSRPASPESPSGPAFAVVRPGPGRVASAADSTTSDPLNFIETTIIFKVQDAQFSLPRKQVLKSGFFRGMLESPHLGDSKEGTAEHPIVFDAMTGITKSDMKSFCAILDIRAFESETRFSIAQWTSAYRLAKMWDFEQLRDYIFKHLDESTSSDPLKRIEIADLLGFDQWIAPALAQLCHRKEYITPMDGVRLGFNRFAEVCRLREHPRQRFAASEYEKWLDKETISMK
ncbi:hypothetical protein FRC01_010371 [Tulasnella sp. 417]|nr:hypothetical protein FRC01_010371 [Tulasnella sp. 417]